MSIEAQLFSDLVTVHHLGPEFSARTLVNQGYVKLSDAQHVVLADSAAALREAGNTEAASALDTLINQLRGIDHV